MKKRNLLASKINSHATTGRKAVAWLIDPDKIKSLREVNKQLNHAVSLGLDFIFFGGSLVSQPKQDSLISEIKSLYPKIPIILFPGSIGQFSPLADGLLFISLISGRNAELLIGQHVMIAPILARSSVEVLPTGYMLVDGGKSTSVHYISQTIPLPRDKPDLAVATALAGSYLGLRYFYLDAGSGANLPVPVEMILAVKKNIEAPLIVGGGLDNLEKVRAVFDNGADVVVIGNGAEKNPDLLAEVLEYVNVLNLSLNIN
ncbi:geranylgeranylglyceryl/heptaprenylglyceryl phosphate synthase [Belliella sp. DSM 111904]|uniref:Geranylgeranylglyceryl phosphate synthase n=1 Tax=Belliella filtrata TaxID=2923435 RepID=A0ABS9UVT8_9BACT|nr:geranylgeranylglyceryl/heptaprenylglyceryl phosphate synthase [Belliella filtrata]MCH7407875.1 geranylgeranylglyceryl/heptaprenylglyceryl phosphate synthase [Belliella filtrata]